MTWMKLRSSSTCASTAVVGQRLTEASVQILLEDARRNVLYLSGAIVSRFRGTKSYAFSRYSLDGANHFACEYCRRGYSFMHLWFDGDEGFVYEQAPVNSYVESAEFADWAASLPTGRNNWSQQRVEEMRAMAPHLASS